jgi:hypothetical protein
VNVASAQPADPRGDEAELVARDVDRADLLEPEVPRRVRVQERPHEAAAGRVDVQRDVEPALVTQPNEQVVDAAHVVAVARERRPQHGRHADRVLVDVRLHPRGHEGRQVAHRDPVEHELLAVSRSASVDVIPCSGSTGEPSRQRS